jgi:ribosomal protein S18 acetylase RimI-like enzyme
MIIREATIRDSKILDRLVNGAYRGEASKKGWTTEADLLDGVRTTEASLLKMLTDPAATILVAEEKEDISGCVYLQKDAGTLYLGMLTVKPEQQGRGLGALLMKAAEEKAANLGCSKIRMTVITARDTLIAYYQRKGFYDTGERQPFPDDPAFGLPRRPLEFMVMEKAIQS